MGKRKTVFVCQECGHTASRWLGKCPSCQAWDTLVEEVSAAGAGGGGAGGTGADRRLGGDGVAVRPISAIEADETARLSTGVGELDRILGGGLVPGSAVLVGGEPGVGKSTLLMQAAHWIATTGRSVLYVTAEESAMQLRLRGERLGTLDDRLHVLAENDLDAILLAIEKAAMGAVVLDSIQMVYWSRVASAPGSVGQVRECAGALIALAKRMGLPLVLVGHVTKDGAIAGPKVLEHMVDAVLTFEGDRVHAARVLRAAKNRYGAVGEIAVFEMAGSGLKPVDDPSRLFLSGRQEACAGTVVTATLQGSRPFLAEVQALAALGCPGTARRRVSGADSNRLAMLLAVLEKRADLSLADQDVFCNVVGGASVTEPGGDLAIALAVAGSLRERTFPADTVAVGEVGLGGEIRPVARLEARLAEAARLGFRRAVIPANGAETLTTAIELNPVASLEQAFQWLE